jgi:SAM-dependent methyltransferase
VYWKNGSPEGLSFLADRIFADRRLIYYREEADPDFWDQHWRAQFAPGIYRTSETGSLGIFPDHLFTRWLPGTGKIIEAGCGYGQLVLALRVRGYDAEGIDSAGETVELIKTHRPDIPVRRGDVTCIDAPDGHYAGYTSIGVVEHRKDGPEPFLREAWRVLAPGGIAIFTVPWVNPVRRMKAALGLYRGIGGEGTFYQYAFSRREFCFLLRQCGFEIVEWTSYDPLKGLRDEVSLVGRMLDSPLIGKMVARIVGGVFRVLPWLGRGTGHMLLVVARRRETPPA